VEGISLVEQRLMDLGHRIPRSLEDYREWLTLLKEHWYYFIMDKSSYTIGEKERLASCIERVCLHADRLGVSLDALPHLPDVLAESTEKTLRYLSAFVKACEERLVEQHTYRTLEEMQASGYDFKLAADELEDLKSFLRDQSCFEWMANGVDAEQSSARQSFQHLLKAIVQFVRETRTEEQKATQSQPKPARSRGPGRPRLNQQPSDSETLLIAALTRHHQYNNGSCLNPAPVGNNELARMAKVVQSTCSLFFKQTFGNHKAYKVMCHKLDPLIAKLRYLNRELGSEVPIGGLADLEG
jgi:hypothetical protein